MGDTFDQPPRVDEDDRRVVPARKFGYLIQRLRPLLVRCDGAQFEIPGQFDGDIHRSAVPRVHDHAIGSAGGGFVSAGEEARHLRDGFLRS